MKDTELITQLLRETRHKKGVTQQSLAHILGLSQSRYSEIEQGKGSLSAEQFLIFMREFSLSFELFNKKGGQTPLNLVKLALKKWGAIHLASDESGLIHTNLYNLYATMTEVLVGYPQKDLICALAPVIIMNRDIINFDALGMKLYDIGLDGRLWWLTEAILWALRDRQKWFIPRELKDIYGESEEILTMKSKAANAFFSLRKAYPTDVLDDDIKTLRVLEKVRLERDTLASKWRLITRIRQEDFSKTLELWEKSAV